MEHIRWGREGTLFSIVEVKHIMSSRVTVRVRLGLRLRLGLEFRVRVWV